MLIDKMRADQLVARKNRDEIATALMTALVGEAAMVGKNAGNRETSDEESVAVVKKFLKNAEETRGHAEKRSLTDDSVNLKAIDREIAILKAYLPQQMSEDAIRAALETHKAETPGANLGTAMKFMKESFGGNYDGKQASVIAKDVFG